MGTENDEQRRYGAIASPSRSVRAKGSQITLQLTRQLKWEHQEWDDPNMVMGKVKLRPSVS